MQNRITPNTNTFHAANIYFIIRLSDMSKLMVEGLKLKKHDTKFNLVMVWNLSIFVCARSFEVKVKTSFFIKKKLPNFTKVMKRDNKFHQLYLKAYKRQKYAQKRWTLFECSLEKRNSGKLSFKALLIFAFQIWQLPFWNFII